MAMFDHDEPVTLKENSLHLQSSMLNCDFTNLEGLHSEIVSSMQPLEDTLQSDKPLSLIFDDLVANSDFGYEYNNENCTTDTNSSEGNYQHSSVGSDLDILSHQLVNDEYGKDWFMLGNPQRNNFKCSVSSTDDIHTYTSTLSSNNHENGRRSYCLGNSNSKNAIAARDNRLKKKKYIENLEESVRNLRAQNDYLLEQSNKTKNTLCGLQNEVLYLRRVIANQSVLSAILKNVVKTPGIKLSTSLNLNSTITNNDCKKERVARNRSCYDSYKLEEDFSAACSKSGAVNSSCSKQIIASPISSKKKSKQSVKRKKEKKRMKYDHKMEENVTVDIECSGDSDASTYSFSPDDSISGGICLHVAGNSVSLELCSHCNKNAHIGIISDHSYVKH